LSEPRQRVTFTRALHNLIHEQQNSKEDDDTKEKVDKFYSKVLNAETRYSLRTFFSKDTRPTKRKHSSNDDRGRNGTEGADAEPGDAREIDSAILRSKGYEVIPDVIVDESGGEWGQMFRVRVARQCSDGDD
jgi:hypothetical protein